MLSKLKKQNRDGFTIIEVMIVLAIAALILLIVLLAVPALQRGSRNTQRSNDVSAIASAIANLISNNGGQVPVGIASGANGSLNICSAGGSASGGGAACTNNTTYETAKLGYYTQANVFLVSTATTPGIGAVGATPTAAAMTSESVTIDTGYTCSATNTVGNASSRTAAIFFVKEEGSGNGTRLCVEQ